MPAFGYTVPASHSGTPSQLPPLDVVVVLEVDVVVVVLEVDVVVVVLEVDVVVVVSEVDVVVVVPPGGAPNTNSPS